MVVLICDDDAMNRQFLANALSLMNCQTVLASNGTEGIALASQETPDLILMDQTMPDMKGYEAMKAIRKNPSLANIPFVMITGDFEVQEFVEKDKPKNCAFLPKPYSLEQLQTTIALALGRSFPT